jgi:MFS family permease
LGTNFPTLVLGRALTGVYIGLSSAAGNAYVGEIASSNIRGILGGRCSFIFVTFLLEFVYLERCGPPYEQVILVSFSV